MAVTTGSEYDHLKITTGENTVRHPLKDATARESISELQESFEARFAGTGKIAASGATASANYAFAAGSGTASGEYSVAVGNGTQASGLGAFAEGKGTVANHKAQHVSGEYNIADASQEAATDRGEYLEIVGNGTDDENRSNARTLDWEGNEAISGDLVINNGKENEVSVSDIADRVSTLEESSGASGDHFPATGKFVAGTGSATGDYASAIGQGTTASGLASHAEGVGTIANHKSQHVFGEHNLEDVSEALAGERGLYVEVVGNGTSSESKSNARTLDWNGNEVLAGGLTASGNITTSGNVVIGGTETLDATELARLKRITITDEAFNSLKSTVNNINDELIPGIQSDFNRTGTGLIVDLNDNKLYLTHNGVKTGTGVDFSNGLAFDTGKIDENGLLHLLLENQDIEGFTPFYVGTPGGGTTGGGTVSITRITDASVDCIYGRDLYIEYTFTGEDAEGNKAGDGTGTWYVNGIIASTNNVVKQGDNTVENGTAFNIGQYLHEGQNTVRLQVSVDIDGVVMRTAKTWSVNAVNMYFVWTYDDARINTDNLLDRWTVYGGVYKTTHTLLDNNELPELNTEGSGESQEIIIPKQEHGAHSIERWITAEVNGEQLTTEHQYHEIIFVEDGNTTPIVAISMMDSTPDTAIEQYDTVEIPVMVYDPSSLTANAVLRVDGEVVGTWTDIDRTVHKWSYTPTTPTEEGQVRVLSVTCGTTTAEVRLIVRPININISEIDGYSFKFKASDMATNDAVKAWSSNGVTATFSDNFDWVNGGLKTEMVDDYGNVVKENGFTQQYFCIKAGTTMTINHSPFSTDIKKDGLSLKIIFKVSNVRTYDTSIASCFGNDAGLRMYSHEAIFQSPSVSLSVPYSEDEYTELEFDVYKAPVNESDTVNFPYIMAWEDGVISSFDVYADSDNFSSSEKIVIGSNDCDVYLYLFKVYPNYIERNNHLKNFIADAPNASQMKKRFYRNDIYKNSEIDYQELAIKNPDCRVWVYEIPSMTRGKDKKVDGCKFTQIWTNGDKYYNITGEGEMSVQGTSSVDYIRGAANTDINFKRNLIDGYENDLLAGGVTEKKYGKNWYAGDSSTGKAKVFTVEEARENAGIQPSQSLGPEWIPIEKDSNGEPTKYIKALGIKLNDDSCPITYVNTKVNFASCEQVNNMCNAAWYQAHSPYPSTTARDCMEFNMGVQFISDSNPDDVDLIPQPDGRIHMYSIANMGNSKKNVHVLHDLSNPNECCIEVNNNLNNMCRMLTVDGYDNIDWTGDIEGADHSFGMRYPDVDDPSDDIKGAWKRFVEWMALNNPMPYDAEDNPHGYTGERLKDENNNPITVHYDEYTFRGHDRPGNQVLQGTKVTQYKGDYTHDTFEYRMAKMLNECEDYMVMDSVVYHFLFIERHTMVDNVAKNTFWSCSDMSKDDQGHYHGHWDLSKAYDMDTSDGNNNRGALAFDYGNEYDDKNGNDTVFNAQDSVWFRFIANLYEACRTMYIACDSTDTWSGKKYHQFLLSEQRKIPECVWVQCYWLDYIRTYEQNIERKWKSYLSGGRKIHQRGHFEYFQDPYMASKYRSSELRTTNSITLRGYSPEGVYDETTGRGIKPKGEVRVKMYNKMYCIVDVDGNIVSQKVDNKDNIYTLNFESIGRTNDTVINIYPATFIQEIYDLAQLYPEYSSFSSGTRLKSLEVGSGVDGYANLGFKSIELSNNKMLEYLDVRNLPNAESALSLTNCPSLKTLYADGSGFTAYQFANGGLLSKATLERPVAIVMQNLKYLKQSNFTVNDYSRLSALRIENVNYSDDTSADNINTLAMVQNSIDTLLTARLLDVDWHIPTGEVLEKLYNIQGYDDKGYIVNPAVVTGEVYVGTIRESALNKYNEAWGDDLTIRYGEFDYVYEVSFWNDEAETIPILDSNGNPYVQMVERDSAPVDPITSGDIARPTKEPDARFIYTFDKWDDIESKIYGDKKIHAIYKTRDKTYTIRWYDEVNGRLLKTTTAIYGDEVKYNDENVNDFPTYTARESTGVYYTFIGWDKSTGFIDGSKASGFDDDGNLNVYARWDIYALNPNEEKVTEEVDGQTVTVSKSRELNDMPIGQIYAISRNKKADAYWDEYDYVDITVGKDYTFNNVQSRVIAENMYFDGSNPLVTDIQLFKKDAPTFTLAIDFEFACNTQNVTLASCYESDGDEGFRLVYNNNPCIQWGSLSASQVVGCKGMRGIVVLKHYKGNDTLYIMSDKSSGNSSYYSNTVNKTQITRVVSTETNAYFTLGDMSYVDMNQQTIPATKGWVHWCKIWYADLGDTIIEQIANWPHETWRMHYCGSSRYVTKEGDLCAGSFIANALLPLRHYIATNSGNIGGWRESKMRALTNGRCYNALPVGWQFIVRTVQVPSSIGEQQNIIAYAEDKIYIPAIAEVNSSFTASPYSKEGTIIKWFTTDKARIKAKAIIIPSVPKTSDMTYISQDASPSSDYGDQIKTGCVWYSSASGATRVFIEKDISDKHWYFGDLPKESNSNLVAKTGPADNQIELGYWIHTSDWTTRSPSVANSSGFVYIYDRGYTYSSTSSTTYGAMLLCFSI